MNRLEQWAYLWNGPKERDSRVRCPICGGGLLSLFGHDLQVINSNLERINSRIILLITCNELGFSVGDITDIKVGSRAVDKVMARRISMYLSRKYTNESLQEIGRTHNRDHSTVVAAITKIKDDFEIDWNGYKTNMQRIERVITETLTSLNKEL